MRDRDLDRCRWCGLGQDTQVHHIVFRSQGGKDTKSNLITLCGDHHRKAHGLGWRIEPWQLQMLIMFDFWGWESIHQAFEQPNRLLGKVVRVCLSCQYRTETMHCLVWEHDVDVDYGCAAWKAKPYEP